MKNKKCTHVHEVTGAGQREFEVEQKGMTFGCWQRRLFYVVGYNIMGTDTITRSSQSFKRYLVFVIEPPKRSQLSFLLLLPVNASYLFKL